jgi:hypothetical protein
VARFIVLFSEVMLFTNDSFRALAMQGFLEKYPGREIPPFASSDGFIADFK